MKRAILIVFLFLSYFKLIAQEKSKFFYMIDSSLVGLTLENTYLYTITKDSSLADYYTIVAKDQNGNWQGIAKSYYMDGKLKEEATYINHMKSGIVKAYYENAQLKSEVNYLNGERSGLAVYYYDNGAKKMEGKYYKGNTNVGKWMYYYSNSKLRKEAVYYYDDKENPLIEDRDSIIVGYWDILGNQTIKDGNGEYIDYYKDGNVKEKGFYKNHQKEGIWTGLYDNGDTYYEEKYTEGKFQKGVSYSKQREKFEYVELLEGPLPQKGMDDFFSYLGRTMKYPKEARRQGIQGKVYVQFIIEKDGALSNIEVIRGIGGGCDEASIEVISKSPSWKAGKIRGQSVRQRMVIPLIYKLG